MAPSLVYHGSDPCPTCGGSGKTGMFRSKCKTCGGSGKAEPPGVLQITDAQMAEYKKTFAQFDKDGSGSITTKELGNALRAHGENPTDEQLADMINEVDENGNGTLEFADFVKIMTKKTELIAAFKTFDRDGNGYFSIKELKGVMKNMGEKPLTDKEFRNLIREADKDKDGKINYEELSTIMMSGPVERRARLSEAFKRFDRNGDGTVSDAELKHALMNFGNKLTEEDIDQMIQEVDMDHDGQVNYQEFVKMMCDGVSARRQGLIDAFKEFDTDGSGTVSAAELYNALTSHGDSLSEEEVEEMIMEADVDGDGSINYEEFVYMMMSGKKEKRKRDECVNIEVDLRKMCATMLQTRWRIKQAGRERKKRQQMVTDMYEKRKAAAIKLQCWFRRCHAKNEIKRRQDAVFKEIVERQTAAVKLQSAWRVKLGKKERQARLDKVEDEIEQRFCSAVILQCHWRMHKAVKERKRLKEERDAQGKG